MPWLPTGGGVPSSDEPIVSIVHIPDTQYLTEDFPSHFDDLVDWILDNLDTYNIQLILHTGDVTDDGDDAQFEVAEVPMNRLFQSGVPFIAASGNHDYDDAGDFGVVDDHDDTSNWNQYFGPDVYTDKPWFDGDFRTPGESENMYVRVNVGGRAILVLCLEFFPRAAVMTWAEGVIEDNPLHDVIVITHGYMNNDGTLLGNADQYGPDDYGISADAASGEEMWESFKQFPNVVAVFSGHVIGGDNMSHLQGEGDEGNLVWQQFANWQEETEGGEGRIVLWQIAPITGRVLRQVYNPQTPGFESTYELEATWFGSAASEGGGPTSGRWEVIVSGTAPPVAVTNEAEDDWVYGFISD